MRNHLVLVQFLGHLGVCCVHQAMPYSKPYIVVCPHAGKLGGEDGTTPARSCGRDRNRPICQKMIVFYRRLCLRGIDVRDRRSHADLSLRVRRLISNTLVYENRTKCFFFARMSRPQTKYQCPIRPTSFGFMHAFRDVELSPITSVLRQITPGICTTINWSRSRIHRSARKTMLSSAPTKGE